MTKQISFTFQEKEFSATYVVSSERFPFYIFVSLLNPELIKQFGEDIAIKSDGKRVLGGSDIPEGIQALRKVLFTHINKVEQLNTVPMPKLEEWQNLQGGHHKFG